MKRKGASKTKPRFLQGEAKEGSLNETEKKERPKGKNKKLEKKRSYVAVATEVQS